MEGICSLLNSGGGVIFFDLNEQDKEVLSIGTELE